jgi:hypothetical protein
VSSSTDANGMRAATHRGALRVTIDDEQTIDSGRVGELARGARANCTQTGKEHRGHARRVMIRACGGSPEVGTLKLSPTPAAGWDATGSAQADEPADERCDDCDQQSATKNPHEPQCTE